MDNGDAFDSYAASIGQSFGEDAHMDDGGPAIGNVSLLLDALSEDEAEMVMVDEQLGATSEVGPVEGLNAAATGGLLSDESDRKRKREEAEASAKEEKDKALRAECIQKRVLLDDTVIKVQAAAERLIKKRQSRNLMNRQREKEFSLQFGRQTTQSRKMLEKEEARMARETLKEQRAREKSRKEEEKLMMRAERERLRLLEKAKKQALHQDMKEQAALRRKEELELRRAERERLKLEEREQKRIAREAARQQLIDEARQAELARASLKEDTVIGTPETARPIPQPKPLPLDAVIPLKKGESEGDSAHDLPKNSFPEVMALTEFFIQFREVLESAANMQVEGSIAKTWRAVCGTDVRALTYAAVMHGALLRVLQAEDKADRVVQADFLPLFEVDVLSFTETVRLYLETNRSFELEHPGILKRLALVEYTDLSPADRLDILGYLRDLALQTRLIRKFINDVVPDKMKSARKTIRDLQQRQADLGRGLNLESVPNLCNTLLLAVVEATDKDGNELCAIFKELVSAEDYPDYYELIHEPISIAQISERITNNTYASFDECVADFDLMFANAREYNAPDSWVCERASNLEAIVTATAKPLSIRGKLVLEYEAAVKAHELAASGNAVEVENGGAVVGDKSTSPNGRPGATTPTANSPVRVRSPPMPDVKCTVFDDEIHKLNAQIEHWRRAERSEFLGRDRHMNAYLLLDAEPGLHVVRHEGFIGPRPCLSSTNIPTSTAVESAKENGAENPPAIETSPTVDMDVQGVTDGEATKDQVEIAAIMVKGRRFDEVNESFEESEAADKMRNYYDSTNPLGDGVLWSRHESEANLSTLSEALNVDGYREFYLAESLTARERVIRDSIAQTQGEVMSPESETDNEDTSLTTQQFLHDKLQAFMLQMETRFNTTRGLVETSQPTVPCSYSGQSFDRDDWRDAVQAATTLAQLKERLFQISRYLSEKRLRALWYQKTYHQYWANAVEAAQTYGGVTVLACGLMESVKKDRRDKVAVDMDVEVEDVAELPVEDYNQSLCAKCSDGGDLLCCDVCPLSYHIHCLDPPLKKIPLGEWRCPPCKKMHTSKKGKSSYVNLNAKVKVEDACRLCGIGGQLMWCDSCPNVFHLGCLDPPLLEVPEGDWFCDDCNIVRPLVYGKVRGHPLWPARMMVSRGDKAKGQYNKSQLFFFGTHDVQWVGHKNVQAFISTDIASIKCADAKRVKLQEAYDEASKYAGNIRRICEEQGLPDPLLVPLAESIEQPVSNVVMGRVASSGATVEPAVSMAVDAPVADMAVAAVPATSAEPEGPITECTFRSGQGRCKMNRARNLDYCAFHGGLFGNTYSRGTLVRDGTAT